MKTTATVQSLRRAAYEVLAAALDPKSRFYADDCTALWSGLMRKDAAQLRETINRRGGSGRRGLRLKRWSGHE